MDEGVAATAAMHASRLAATGADTTPDPSDELAARGEPRRVGLGRGVVLALPTSTSEQHGPVAGWVSTAGWASALRRVVGSAWIVTPEGVLDECAARARASRPDLAPPATPRVRSRIPVVAKTAIKDLREMRRARAFRISSSGPWDDYAVEFVWQRHELFHRAGLDLARRLRIPAVTFVPAPLVWQANEWGVRRPGWSSALERVEARALRAATIVAAGSDEVAAHVAGLGVRDADIVVTPTGIDTDLFGLFDPHAMTDRAGDERRATRRELGLDGLVVVGWVGSFRRFHALDLAIDALARATGRDRLALLLVGDGPERARVEARARASGIRAVATGTMPHDRIPGLMRAMDIALVLAERGQAFHYSPLKLAEYLASGVAVVAPDAGEIPLRFRAPDELLLFTPGDADSLRDRIECLVADPALRNHLAAAGPGIARTRATWDRSVHRVVAALEARRAAGKVAP